MSEPRQPAEIRVFVDADACPVKNEIYRVAERYGLKVFIVANSFMNVPRSDMVERVTVTQGPDIADDWIAERADGKRYRYYRRYSAGRPLREKGRHCRSGRPVSRSPVIPSAWRWRRAIC